jgi:hypothetical protein
MSPRQDVLADLVVSMEVEAALSFQGSIKAVMGLVRQRGIGQTARRGWPATFFSTLWLVAQEAQEVMARMLLTDVEVGVPF